MQIKLSEFLKEYNAEIPESIRDGEIYRLTYSEKLDHITFYANYDRFVPSDDIFAFEKAAEAALRVDIIRLACRYPSEIFGMDCYGELIKLIKRDVSVVNGFLDDAEVTLSDGRLNIRIVHGGREILDRYDFCGRFARMIYNQFGEALKKIGLSEMEALGQEFDPNIHNAIKQEESDEYGENTVCQVFQKGYMLGDRVVRHAVVAVTA